MTVYATGNVVPFRLWTRFTPRQVTDLFFTAHDKPLEQPSLLRRAFAHLIQHTDIRAEPDSVNAARLALRDRGFSQTQTGIFMGVVQNEVCGFLIRYAQLLHGPDAEIEKLDLYYSHDFHLGVKLDGERLDYTPDFGKQIYNNIHNNLRGLHQRSPDLFEIGAPTLSQRAANRPIGRLQPNF